MECPLKAYRYFKVTRAIFLFTFLTALVLSNAYTVRTGEVAIISTFGKVSKIQEEGLHFKIPFVQTKYMLETREKL